ncbi:MAG: UbiX family flavin prenyltransferase [Desulfurivibrio sp.]|nr:UbiX family flavin prenyltransferase [Desulfurivibrio sp.]MBU4034540.1 UbiX family flavin prenyltransferase [Pseudomonadota bacterium]MBU4118243.1 UbiX family flavin prenyltransferase [Pseudomonadota bacterium]
MKKIVLAITGATGAVYALEFLKICKGLEVEVHGLLSEAGEQVLGLELGMSRADLDPYVTRWHDVHDFAAPMSSGSSEFSGMAVLPCTMGSLAAIANGVCGNLIHRAADVMLKERRPLVLAVRETPLNKTHLLNMLKAHEAGGIICPPMPALYHRPRSIEEMARHYAGRVAGLLGIEVEDLPRWQGLVSKEEV